MGGVRRILVIGRGAAEAERVDRNASTFPVASSSSSPEELRVGKTANDEEHESTGAEDKAPVVLLPAGGPRRSFHLFGRLLLLFREMLARHVALRKCGLVGKV